MKDIGVSDFSNNIFEMSEDSIYKVIEKFKDYQNVDRTITYIFIKAFYLHIVKIYLNNKNNLKYFDKIYLQYKVELNAYYKNNNYMITQELLNDIMEAFDKCFEIVESLNYTDLDDGYEFRHHVINCFDLLIQILENKSKSKIRTDIFENFISVFRNQAEKMIDFTSNCNILDENL